VRNTGLTSRELEIVRLLGNGVTNKELAIKLSLSEKTIKNHISAIFVKLRLKSRCEVAIYAWKNGLRVDESIDNLSLLPADYHALKCAHCEETIAYAKSHDCVIST
jgi:DNA-binding CsgD family transcriptional regulator